MAEIKSTTPPTEQRKTNGRTTTRGYPCHRKRNSTEYRIWKSIKDRCLNSNHVAYPRYGGRGITICEQWRTSFLAFLSDVGERPGKTHSLDRYPDKNGSYEPGNVRWATTHQQNRNRTDNVFLTFNNETLVLADWALRRGMKIKTLASRIRRGWPVELALSAPIGYRPRNA